MVFYFHVNSHAQYLINTHDVNFAFLVQRKIYFHLKCSRYNGIHMYNCSTISRYTLTVSCSSSLGSGAPIICPQGLSLIMEA